ncbi:DUF3870 domain-containing protein [Thermovenabulum sp.]|uniref:DUF3870 domain-containing protein n=1 Tax=Thermovenabulum sp. TaxID=3100335 RepID=UPI003C7A5B08
MNRVNQSEILITGYAKLPEETTAYKLYDVVGIALRINKENAEIIDADITLATSVAKQFFRDAVIGKNLNKIDEIINIFERQYLGTAKKSIITALKICQLRYKNYLKNIESKDE